MSDAFARGTGWLLAQAAALQDTVIVRQVTEDPGTFDKVASVASGLISIVLLVLAVALVPAAWNLRRTHKKLNDLLDQVHADVRPLVRHASSIADNVDYVTTSLRNDVQQVNRTVALANDRVLEAIRLTERRLQEFNALLGVVQEEAEDVFVSTASAVRGLRSGTRRYQEELREFAAEERIEDLDDELADALDESFDMGEDDDGDDFGDGLADRGGTEHPRIRPRGRA